MRRGFTLAEVLVSAALLSLLLTLGLMLTRLGGQFSSRADSKEGVFRQGSLASSRMRRELRGSRIIEPTDGASSEFRFQFPLLNGDRLETTSSGRTEWAGTGRVYLSEGILLLEKPEGQPPRSLARLGEESEFSVTAEDGAHRIVLRILDPETRREVFHREILHLN